MKNLILIATILSSTAFATPEQDHFDDLVLRACENDSNPKCVSQVEKIQAKRAKRVATLHARQAKKIARLNKRMEVLQAQILNCTTDMDCVTKNPEVKE